MPQDQYQFSVPTISFDEIPIHNKEIVKSDISKYSAAFLEGSFIKPALPRFWHSSSTKDNECIPDYLIVSKYDRKKDSFLINKQAGKKTLDSSKNNQILFSTH
jgi:hypothetical protein